VKNKYIQAIANIEGKTIDFYKWPDGTETPDMLIASAIFLCMLDGIIQPKTIAKKIAEPIEAVQHVYENLIEAGYIKNNKIVFHIKNNTKEEWVREYYLFSLAGLGVLKKC